MSISLEQIVGFKVKVTNLLDVATEGKIYSFNSSNNTLTLQTSKRNQSLYNFKVIKCSFIKHLEVVGDRPVSNQFKRQHLKPSYINTEKVEEYLNKRIIQTEKLNLARARGVSPEGQTIFDLIHKTIPDVKWVNKDIIILDDIKVSPPYKVNNITPLHDAKSQSLSLIERILEKGWSQMDMNNDNDNRKGG